MVLLRPEVAGTFTCTGQGIVPTYVDASTVGEAGKAVSDRGVE